MARRIRTYRLTIPDQVNTIILPNFARFVVVKNVSPLVSIRFNFDDDGANDYWTLASGDQSPIFGVYGGENIHTDGVGGSGIVEVLVWK